MEISKSSYYVWFLGSKESKGLRGEEFVKPVVRHLLSTTTSTELMKVTLQVSSKGIKMVYNHQTSTTRKIVYSSSSSNNNNNKQFVPHSSITCVVQNEPPHDDIVSCILLISSNESSSSDCPLYVHSYRCDSAETASLLKDQIQILVERPENIAKYDEIESRLLEKGLLMRPGKRMMPRSSTSVGSDGRSIGHSSSDSSSDIGSHIRPNQLTAAPPASSQPVPSDNPKLVTLYDSLAAELREKLANRSAGQHPPLLLPPKDYDTMHRIKGDLSHVDSRRALNPAIVGGGNVREEQGDSSGIDSDEQDKEDSEISDDEDWPEIDDNDKTEVKPLVSIQSYAERLESTEKNKSKTSLPFTKAKNPGNSKKKNAVKSSGKIERNSSFHEIQNKFKSLERKKEHSDEKVIAKPKKTPEVMEWPKSDRDTGYVSREKSRSSRDFEDSRPSSSSATNKRLESYLSKHSNRSSEDQENIDVGAGHSRVRRQVSKCSSIFPSRTSSNHNNMEAVGEFEKVWNWADHDDSKDDSRVPLTQELSPEYHKSPMKNRVMNHSAEIQPKSRARSPEKHHHHHHHHHHSNHLIAPRGLSTPPGRHHYPAPAHPMGYIPQRPLSPELFRRPSGVRNNNSGNNEPVRILRREKTSFFDNRYPSLDKRKSLYELQDDVNRAFDLRRRSYHELNNPELMHNFQHSGKLPGKTKSKSSKELKKLQKQQQQQLHAHPPHIIPIPPHAAHHRPPPPHGWMDPRAFHHHHPHHPPGMPPQPPIMAGRFGAVRQF